MFRSATEGQLPVLPGIRQYVPKRSAHGRHSLFDCDKSGAMMHKEKMSRPASTPSSQQNLGGSMGRLSSSTLLRPQSALGSSKSLAIFEDPPTGLTETTRKKQQTINSLKALEPLAINQQRVALQRQLRQLEQTEAQMFKENQSTNQLNRSASALAGSVLPRWVKMDREVLRWYCYSKESVPESAYETFRIRKFILYYYLVDGTIRINEPKVKNSGLPGGDVYKRSAMLKRNGTPYGPEDFTTGAEFEICARVYRIVDCDAQTMKHFTKKIGHGIWISGAISDRPIC